MWYFRAIFRIRRCSIIRVTLGVTFNKSSYQIIQFLRIIDYLFARVNINIKLGFVKRETVKFILLLCLSSNVASIEYDSRLLFSYVSKEQGRIVTSSLVVLQFHFRSNKSTICYIDFIYTYIFCLSPSPYHFSYVSFYFTLLLWPFRAWNADLSSPLTYCIRCFFFLLFSLPQPDVLDIECYYWKYWRPIRPTLLFRFDTSVSFRKAGQEEWNNISYKDKCLLAKWMVAESTFVALNFSSEGRKEFTGEEERTMKVRTQVLRSELYIERNARPLEFGAWRNGVVSRLCVFATFARTFILRAQLSAPPRTSSTRRL